MNRLILIGNGFDLAHGMKTSYRDFIDAVWQNKIKSFMKTYKNFHDDDIEIKGFNPHQIYDYPKMETIETITEFIDFLKKNKATISYKNEFFKIITNKHLFNWVDIEEEYYKQLLDILNHRSNSYSINQLNKDFQGIKNLLHDYIVKISENQVETIDCIVDKIYSKIKLHDFLTYPKKTLFLNFNYTKTDKQYIDVNKPNLFSRYKSDFSANYGITKESIHIHGELNNPENPIIFGYGDELGDDYAAIEKTNDNNYLENVKSIKYSETNNYKRLLEFIDSDTYQIFIFGHSCGISDRTLLNTLFEHKNCVSIKPYYHKKADGTDNYSDLTRNISRNFTDKRMMREKVVNKMYCEPLSNI
jgi:hypothetical protein